MIDPHFSFANFKGQPGSYMGMVVSDTERLLIYEICHHYFAFDTDGKSPRFISSELTSSHSRHSCTAQHRRHTSRDSTPASHTKPLPRSSSRILALRNRSPSYPQCHNNPERQTVSPLSSQKTSRIQVLSVWHVP